MQFVSKANTEQTYGILDRDDQIWLVEPLPYEGVRAFYFYIADEFGLPCSQRFDYALFFDDLCDLYHGIWYEAESQFGQKLIRCAGVESDQFAVALWQTGLIPHIDLCDHLEFNLIGWF